MYQIEPHGVTGKAASRGLTLKSFSPKSEAGLRGLCGSDRSGQGGDLLQDHTGTALPESAKLALYGPRPFREGHHIGAQDVTSAFQSQQPQVQVLYPVQATFKPCHLRDTDSMTVRKEGA